MCHDIVRRVAESRHTLKLLRAMSYGCTREVAKHERSVRVARGESREQL